MQQYTAVTGDEVANDPTLTDWRFVHGVIRADFGASSYPAATELAMAIATAAEAAEHHPDIDIRYPGRVRVTLTTHATGGVTDRDVSLARTIADLAAAAGASSEPGTGQSVEIAIDTTDADRIRPFWQAVLGYDGANDSLVDPARSGPTVWFQPVEVARTERSRLHIDIDIPHDLVEERMAAAIAAGGTLMSSEFAPSWWVLADADGNEACLCTWEPRD